MAKPNRIIFDTNASIEWLDIFMAALGDRDEGMFPLELRQWFVDTGQDLNGRTFDPAIPPRERMNDPEFRELSAALGYVAGLHAHWGVLTSTEEVPTRVYEQNNLGLGLFDEPCIRLSPRGRGLGGAPTWRKWAFFLPRVTWQHTQPLRQILRMPLAVASGVLGVSKFITGWETIHAAASAVAAGILVAIARAMSRR